jgi:hypothetical protein
MATPKLLKAALNCFELANNLENISHDDRKEIANYTDAEILAEARYVKECYEESGHALCDYLNSDESVERRVARRDYRKLLRFIDRYAPKRLTVEEIVSLGRERGIIGSSAPTAPSSGAGPR